MKYPFLTKDFLQLHFIDEAKSATEIQIEFNIQSYGIVEYYIRKYKLCRPKRRYKPIKKFLSKVLLLENLLILKLNQTQIAKKYNVSRPLIRRRIKQYNIKIIHARKLLNKDLLYQLYVIEHKSTREIGKMYNSCRDFVIKQLNLHNIRVRGAKFISEYKDISHRYWTSLIRGAKYRNIKFNVSPEYIWNIWEKQNSICAISGENIILTCFAKQQTASLDRIDSKQGYIEGNLQWVHKKINKLKNNLPISELFDMAKKIVIHNKLC